MRITKYRFFLTSTGKVMEKITWLLCGTEIIPIDDSRGVSIGEEVIHPETSLPIDHWFPLSVINAAFDVSATVSYATEAVKTLDYDENSPTFGQTITIQQPIKTLSNNFDYYNEPLLPGYTEITEIQFNDPAYPP